MTNYQKLLKKQGVVYEDFKPFIDSIKDYWVERSLLNILLLFFIWLKSEAEDGE